VTKKVIVLAGEGVGIIAAMIISQHPNMQLVGFLNDVVPVGTRIGNFNSYPVLGKSKEVLKFIEPEDTYAFMGFIGMTHEEEVYDKLIRLGIPREKFINLIHPTAIVPEGFCSIGNGILMAPHSQLSADVTLGDNCMMMGGSFVGHNSTLDRYVSLATNSVVGANVHVGKAVHIGSNATIREKLTIGDFSLVGMGSVVLKDVPSNTIVAGNPARVISSRT
jgi:acetyltransferase EpsM